MTTPRRLILSVIGVVVVLLIVAASALYWFLSGDAVRQTLEAQASDWLGEPVQIASARARIFPRLGVRLDDVRIGEPATVTLQSVQLSTALRALLGRRIEDAEIIVSDSRLEMPLPFGLPDLADDPDDDAAPVDEGPGLQLVSVRSIALRDVVIASRGREIVVSADSSLVGDRLELQRFSAVSGPTSLEATGTVELAPRLSAELEIAAGRVDIDELMALAAAFTPPSNATAGAGAAGVPGRLAARVTADTATAGEIEIRQFVTMMDVEGDRATLSPLTFELFGGKYEGSLETTLGEAMSATLESRINGLDVAQLAAFGGSPDTITGTLSGEGTFRGKGADVAAILQTVRGSGTAAIVDGTVQRLDLVRTVVLFFGRPAGDAPPATDRFERMEMQFSLADQVFRAEAFTLRSPDVDIAGEGTLTVPTKALDGRATLMLSEELSAQAGADLVRYTRENGRVTLPARISGTLEQPRIMIDAAAAVERGLRREVERRLEGLFDRFAPGRTREQEPEFEAKP